MRVLIALALLAACGDDGTAPTTDAGPRADATPTTDAGDRPTDAGPIPTTDAATTDAGPTPTRDAGPLGPGSWETRERLVEPNSECAVAELDGIIYVIGGYPADRVTADTVQRYEVATDTWRLSTPLPRPLNHTVAAAANGHVYVFGGQTSASSTDSYVSDVFELDPTSETWRSRAPMPTARSGGAAAVVDGLIYVAGGRPPRGQDFAVYDPVADDWTELPPIPTGRNHIAAGAVNGIVLVAGGRFGGGFTSEHTDILEAYDPATREWTTRAPMPTSRSGVNGIGVGGCLYVWGGEASSGVFEENEVYHLASDTWRSLAPLPTPVHGVTGAAHIDGLIYAPGGGTDVGGSSGSTLFQVFRTAGTCPD